MPFPELPWHLGTPSAAFQLLGFILWYSRVLGQDHRCQTQLHTWHLCRGCSGSENTWTGCEGIIAGMCAMVWAAAWLCLGLADKQPGLHCNAVLVCQSSSTALFPRNKHRALEVWPGSQAGLDLSWAEHAPAYRMDVAITLPKQCKNTWQPLASYSSVTRKKGDSTWLWWLLQLLFREVIKFSNIFTKCSGKRNMNTLKSYNSKDSNSSQIGHRCSQPMSFALAYSIC